MIPEQLSTLALIPTSLDRLSSLPSSQMEHSNTNSINTINLEKPVEVNVGLKKCISCFTDFEQSLWIHHDPATLTEIQVPPQQPTHTSFEDEVSK